MKFIIYIIFSLPILYFFYLVILYFRTHVPFVTTAQRYIPTIFKELKINQQTIIYDLGCGKGDFLFEAEKYHPKELVGIDLSPLHILYAKFKTFITKSNVRFYCQDFFKTDISKADVIYLFLVKVVLNKKWIKIKKEAKKGAIVLTLGDKIDGAIELKHIVLEPNKSGSSRVWVYQI
ncbi:MAG: class I SAM-dependent methyltransferase [bacterium]|nr:class I SAM-dependent methyltransferase [bacterium]